MKLLSSILFFTILGLALFWMDGSDFTRSYNDSIARGEELRKQLRQFFELHSTYPMNLKELGMTKLPGTRWYGKTIIFYKKESSGYTLSFGDKFITWIATDKDAFMAKK